MSGWATNNAPRTGSPNTQPGRSPSSQAGWGASSTSNPPVRGQQPSPARTGSTGNVSSPSAGWGASANSANPPRSPSSPSAGWGASAQPRPGQGQVDPNRHQPGGWAAQAGVTPSARVTGQERTFADDVIEAGNQAYQQYLDEQREKEALTPEVTTQRMLRLAQETTDIADRTISTLEVQNEELKRQQQEVADINNDLNTSEKKMRAIKSGW